MRRTVITKHVSGSEHVRLEEHKYYIEVYYFLKMKFIFINLKSVFVWKILMLVL